MSTDLTTLDSERLTDLVSALPTEKRAAFSKAAQAAIQHIRDAKLGYDKAYDLSCAMVKNWHRLGVELNGMDLRPGRRSENSDLSHHLTLADLGLSNKQSSRCQRLAQMTDDQLHDWLLSRYDNDGCKLPTLTAAQLAAARDAARIRNDCVGSRIVESPVGLYDVIVIDPPWPMKKIERDVSPDDAGFDYPTLPEDELASMDIPAADDCHMWLWTTQRFLPMALRLLPRSPQFVDLKDFWCGFDAPRRGHSVKPDEFYDMVRRVTDGRRIDMFNRRLIEGFDVWGNESNGNVSS